MATEIKQLTKEQAIAFYNSKEWESWSHEQIVKFQLFQDKLRLPFDKFHEAIEKVLGRPVFTHEWDIKPGLKVVTFIMQDKSTKIFEISTQ